MCFLQIRYLISPSTMTNPCPSRPTPPRGCPLSPTQAVSPWSPPPPAATACGQSQSWVFSPAWWAMLPPAPALPPLPRKQLLPPLRQRRPRPPLLPLLHLRPPASVPPFTTASPTPFTQLPQLTPVLTLTSSQIRARHSVQVEQCSTLLPPTQTGRPPQASLCPWFQTTCFLSSRGRSAWCLPTRSPSRVNPANPPSPLCPPLRPSPPRLVPRT